MTMVSVTKIFHLEAAHHLPHHGGKCHFLHGHSYKLEVTVTGPLNLDPGSVECGMIIDFSHLKKVVQENIIEVYDHQNLNEHMDNPTAENLCVSWGRTIQKHLPHGIFVKSCKVWETCDSYAEYTPDPTRLDFADKPAPQEGDQPTLAPAT